jgi:superfamily I DNA/RNA helicase
VTRHDDYFTEEQRAFIHADCDTYVAACPGAGKTAALVERFISRPNVQVGRRGVALISFTNAAVREARSRCSGSPELLTSPNFVGTIDSFINRFIVGPVYSTKTGKPATFRDTWAAVPGTTISVQGVPGKFELDWFEILDEQTASINPQSMPYRLRGLAHQLRPSEKRALAEAALRAWTRQRSRGVFDAASARSFLVECLDEPAVCNQVRGLLNSRFAEVIVDEVQDCRRQDALLLSLVREANIRLVATGDPDQAIYDFRGGTSDELTTLLEGLTPGRRLSGNFRSAPAICSAVDSLRSTGENDSSVGPLRDSQEPVHVIAYRVAAQVAASAVDVLSSCGVSPADTVVLAHAEKKARECSGSGSPMADSDNRLVLLATAVQIVVSATSDSPARRRAFDRLGRLIRELGSEGDAGLSQVEYLERHGLTERSFQDACLRLAFELSNPFDSSPQDFRNTLAALEGSQKQLGWSPRALRTPRGNRWPSTPNLQTDSLAFSTIHAFKGLQIPAVVLVIPENRFESDGTDDWANGRATEARRVLYVGASRAQRLLVVAVHHSRTDTVVETLSRDGVPFVVHDQA